MRLFKLLGSLCIALALGFTMGCEEDDTAPDNGLLIMKMMASSEGTATSSAKETESGEGILIGEVMFTDFQLAIRDVTFKAEELDTAEDKITFEGPFLLDLLNEGDALSQTVGERAVPNGTYKQVRFDLHKDKEVGEDSPLHGRSVYIKGMIGDKPFEMWHDTDEKIDVGGATGVTVNNNEAELVVIFDLSMFLEGEYAIDLSQAQDGNQDGLIEIHPNDPDGNNELADQLKENIKNAAKVLDQ